MSKKLTFILYCLLVANLNGQNLHVKGNFINAKDSTISFHFSANPLTSETDKFITAIDNNGSFQFSYKTNAPRQVSFQIGENTDLIAHFIIFPNGRVNITADCKNFKETLKITGDNQKLTTIRDQLFSNNFEPDTTYFNLESQDWKMFEDKLNIFIRNKLTLLDSLHNKYSLSKAEYDYAWAEIYYSYFHLYMYHTWGLKIPENHQVYSFYDLLDLSNDSIALLNNNYNNYIEYALLHKYKEQNNSLLERSIPDSSFFFNQYEFGKKQLSNIVRDVFLTRLLFRVLNQGVPGTDQLYSQYLSDCNMTQLKTIIIQEYNVYLLTINKETKANYVIISNPEEEFNDFLLKYKGKVLLLEYWGSWCSPCIKAIPEIKTLEKQFNPEEFQIIHIAVRDTYEKMKFAIEKYNIGGVNVLLPQSINLKWKSKINVYTVPYYAIINRNGKIIEDGPLGLYPVMDLTDKLTEIIKQKE